MDKINPNRLSYFYTATATALMKVKIPYNTRIKSRLINFLKILVH